MSGYNGYSKSNNAIAAEAKGLLPASVIAKQIGHGATAAGVKAVLTPLERHHTSKMYNCTDYYDLDAELNEANEKGQDLIEMIITASKSGNSKVYYADVEYDEFFGSRKRPRSKKYIYKNIKVEEKGDWYIFYLPDGTVKRKGLYSACTIVKFKREM